MIHNILITGHKGFIGRNLQSFLNDLGYNTFGFDIVDYIDDNSLFFDLKRTIPHVDLVIHLGANSNTTEYDLQKILYENFWLSKELFKLCREKGVRFTYASSASVYGKSSLNFKEDEFCKPLNPYAFSKYMFDCWADLQDFRSQGLRFFNVYSNDEESKGNQASPIFKFLKQANETGIIKVFEGSENYRRDFVSIDDVCLSMLMFIENPDLDGVFNIGTGNPISFLDVAELIAEKTGAKIEEIPFPEHLREHYQVFTKANLGKFNANCGIKKWKTVEEYLRK